MSESEDADRSATRRGAGIAAPSFAGADPGKLNQYLDEQIALTRLQIEDLRREEVLRSRSLRVRHAIDLLKLALEGFAALVVGVATLALIATVWVAAHSEGLVVEPFAVPPDLANRGLTGEVVAAKILDRLAAIQAQTVSNRAASSFANNWGNDIKVQIPQTGVSFGEANRFLRGWLGHETHVTGEITRSATGLAIVARTGGRFSPTFKGAEADLDTLLDRAAQAVYRATQPYRYAVYLSAHGRDKEATAIYRALLLSDSQLERAWAYVGLSQLNSQAGQFEAAIAMSRQAIALRPGMLLPYENLAAGEGTLEHDEASLTAIRKAIELAERGRDPTISEDFFRVNRIQDRTTLGLLVGDFQSVLALDKELLARPDRVTWEGAWENDIESCGALHDARCLVRAQAAPPRSTDPFVVLSREGALQKANADLGRWSKARELGTIITAKLETYGDLGRRYIRLAENPLAAIAAAHLGDFATANRLIADTPLDCVTCLRYRGRIAALQGRWREADSWFARAVSAAPSVPFAYADWGEALLRKGDGNAAAAKLRIAVSKGPRFADPLVLWGEVLIQQNRSDLALAKFEAASDLAPKWARLHLKWGEALFHIGRKDEAARQFAIAGHLELTPEERAEMERYAGRT